MHRGHKAVAPAMHRLDAVLAPPTITHRPAGLHQPMVQGGLADHAVGPDVLQEFVPADDTIAVLDEIDVLLTQLGNY
jgi:hypothetical protein